MFHAAARAEEVGLFDGDSLAGGPVASLAVPAFEPASIASRYGERRSINLPAIAAILLVHVVAITAIMQVRQHIIARKEASLTVVNLSPPPPPPASEEQPPPSQPEIVAPPPLVRVPLPPVQKIVTTPVPSPMPTPVIAAPKPIAASAPVAVSAPPSTVQSSDLSTRMLSGKPPRYPIESRRKREQGTVLLSLTLGVDGKVSVINIAKSSGFARLDDAARDAVRNWRWAPTVRDGQAVMVRGLVEIPFMLQG
ncbi:energy transducer TonB [Sphingobium aromaticiconvertens]|uniref:energy transducer TonB n=1 Tax=Sphingobium aromaticiconvertens TaxID=365341 RepID=UPI003016C915